MARWSLHALFLGTLPKHTQSLTPTFAPVFDSRFENILGVSQFDRPDTLFFYHGCQSPAKLFKRISCHLLYVIE